MYWVIKLKRRELFTMPLMIIILSVFIYLVGSQVTHPFLKIMFPQNDNIFELFKIYFSAFLIIYLLEFFIENDINNYLFSRVVSLYLIMIVSGLLYFLLPFIGHLKLLITMVISVVIAQSSGYKLQKISIKNSDILALIMQSLLAIFIAYITYYPLNVF